MQVTMFLDKDYCDWRRVLTVNMRQEPTIKSALPEREDADKSAATAQRRPSGLGSWREL